MTSLQNFHRSYGYAENFVPRIKTLTLLLRVSLVRKVSYNYKKKYLKSIKLNLKILLIGILLFLIAELFWRMIFEMIIAYFNIHEYLYQIVQQV